MINNRTVWMAGLLACLAPAFSFADKLGDPAPPLTVAAWVKGKPVKIQPGTNTYVIALCTLSRLNEFGLATLGKLQKEYQEQGVVFVVISDEPVDQVKSFVQLKGDQISFTVAVDNIRKTTLNYLRAYQQMVLPRAFVVGKDGTVLWHGHPAGGLNRVLAEVVSGRYDLEQARKDLVAREEMETYLALASKDEVRAKVMGWKLLTLRTNDAVALRALAFNIATNPYLEYRDVALANEALDRAAQLSPTNTSRIDLYRAILLFQTGQQAEGLAKAKQALAAAKTPDDREEAQKNLRAMEVRLAATNTNQNNAVESKP